MRKLCIILALALVLSLPVSAATLEDLEQNQFYNMAASDVLKDFMAKYDLNSDNFAMGYCNTLTGELISFNGDKLMLAASTYKLPLNMLFTDMLRDGTLTEEDEITSYLTKTLAEGETLPEGAELIETQDQNQTQTQDQPVKYKIAMSGVVGDLMRRSVVDSDNDASEILLRYAYEGQGYDHYLDRISIYGDYDFSGYDREKLYENYFPSDYMLGCLKYLYEHSGEYKTVIEYMKQAMPGMYFKTYLSCEVAHKYGYFNAACNDVGIVYTNTPFLLSCYTYGLSNGGEVVARLAEYMADYTNYRDDYLAYLEAEAAAAVPEGEEALDNPEGTDIPEGEDSPEASASSQQEAIDQMIAEIQAMEEQKAQATPEPTPEPPPEPTPESIPEVTPEPTPEPVPEPTPEPEPEPKKGLDLSMVLCGFVIVAALAIILIVALSGRGGKRVSKNKKRVRRGKYTPKH